MNDPTMPEALDDFLDHPPQPAEPAGLRDRALLQAAPILRRRRIVRRSLWGAGALAASIVLFALWSWSQHEAPKTPEEPPPLAQQKPAPAPPVEEKKEPTPSTMPLAVALEWKAFDAAEKERAKLYVLAGNRYLDEHQDMTSALRCYRQALDTADAPMREVQPDDSWLLTALKLDRH